MCGSKKNKTSSTSTFTPTAEASGLYNQAIGSARNIATTPYDTGMDAQTAGFSPDQLAAFQGVQDAQGAWSPYFDQSAQFAEGAAGPIDAGAISGYMDPYIQQVIDATLAQTNRQDAIQQARLRGNAVSTGALGGNATGVNSAVLAGEQGRNRNSMIANLLSSGYGQALGAAQQDASRQMAAAGHFGQLGQSTQQALYNDVNAQLTAGNQQQGQQQQVLDTNTANAQQQHLYPYQQTQWLSSIGAGLGPLTGGTTTGNSTTEQGKGIGDVVGPALTAVSMLSDRRAKEDVKQIGKTDDGQPIYKYRYKGQPNFQIGLMADEVEDAHPDAVGVGPYGMKTVDYDKATGFADGGGVFGGRGVFGGSTVMPWADIRPAAMNQPSLPDAPQVSQGGGSGGPFSDPAKAIELGKSARTGLEDLYRSIDPAGGWGASIEPLSGGSGGSFLSSLFGGFADGGEIDGKRGRFRLADQIRVKTPSVGFATGGAIDPLRALYGPGFEGFPAPASDIMPDVGLSAPSVEHLGQIGDYMPDDNVENLGQLDDLPYAEDVENLGQLDDLPSNDDTPWYMKSLTDLLGITEGQTDPTARLSFRQGYGPPARDPLTPNAPQLDSQDDGGFSLDKLSLGDDGAIRYNGQSFAEHFPIGKPEEKSPSPFDNPMPYDTSGMDAAPEFSTDIESAPAATPEPTPGILGTSEFIKQQEGFTPKAKWDVKQFSSGYGTTAQEGETIDRAEAERRMQSRIGDIESWIDGNITAQMTPGQRTGLVSFAYNLGVDDLEKLKGDINKGDWGRVAARIKSFNKAENEAGELEVVKGLTNRRLREAALVSGGASLPEGVSDLPPQMGETAAKGFAKQDVGGDKYRGKEDRQTGGLLKRMFGFDFNPLNLNEDERMAMLVAGLSMMSSGDVGSGGLAGLSYLSNKQAVDRKTAVGMAKLALKQQQYSDKNALELLKITSASNKPTNAMKEFQFSQDNPDFLDFMRRQSASKASGSGEQKARFGMSKGFDKDVPAIIAAIQKFDNADRVNLALGRGDATEVWRRVATGVDALVRNMTGAAMPEAEARNYAMRYQIQPTDRTETMVKKIQLLQRDLRRSFDHLKAFEETQGSGGNAEPLARNAQGDVIKWNGSAWVPFSAGGSVGARP